MATTPAFRPEPSFEEAERIQQFWDEHYRELLGEFPEQFVAVRDGRVVASNRDLALLFYELRALGLDAQRDVAIQFISATSASLLL